MKKIAILILILSFVTVGFSQSKKLERLNDKYYKVYDKGNYEKALKIALKTLKYSQKKFGTKSIQYANSMGLIGDYYLDMGEYSVAEKKYNESIQIFNELNIRNTEDYANIYNSMGIMYKNIGNYEKAQQCYNYALDIFCKLFGEDSDYSGMVYNNLGTLYRYLGDYEKAEYYTMKCADIYKKYYGENSFYYSQVLNNLGNLYSDLNNVSKAEECFIKSAEIRKNIYGEKSVYYAMIMNNLGGLYIENGMNNKAESCYNITEYIYNQVYGSDNYYNATILNNLGIVNKNLGNFSKAKDYYLKSLSIRLKVLGEKHPEIASSYYNLGVLYELTDSVLQAEKYFTKSLILRKELLGINNINYAISLDALGHFYYFQKNYDSTEKYWIEYNDFLNKNLEKNFKFLSESEKEKFSFKFIEYFDNISSFIYNFHKPELFGLLYNNELSHKGMILNSAIAFNQLVNTNNDSTVKVVYSELLGIKQVLSKMYELPINERYFNTDSLEDLSNNLEKQLNNRLSFLGFDDFSNIEEKNWADIKNILKPDEAAIEFTNFKYLSKLSSDSILYCALIITKNSKNPELIFLFEEKQLKSLLYRNPEFQNDYNPEYSYISKLYSHNSKTSDSLYNLIWKPLEKYLGKIKKIYISPSGLLNNIAFDALTTGSKTILADKYKINYLSTTSNLLNHKDLYIKDIKKSVVFGGITYDEDTSLMIYASKPENIKTPDLTKIDNWIKNKPQMPQFWSYLPGSFSEAKSIDSLFKKSSKSITFYNEYKATEEVFKSFSVNSPDIIHIASHGFYFENDSSKNYSLNLNLQFAFSDNPLMRSGILLSGGNYVWIFNKRFPNVEDGVLSAYEISHLALFNTKLVVLSACQTGLGEIKGSEGVYGLRRALKMAGVDYIIMSLWSVPDIQTKELMVEFYKNFLKGQELRASFRLAQDYMKKKYKDVPGAAYAWAAFVLIE